MMDSKFGIYSHWGPQSITVTSGGDKVISEAGDIFERWSGDKFDAKEWVELYKVAGAQFAGPVVQHGTGCVNWDSEVTDWNSVNKGPKVDILGELSREIHAADMKVIATFHNIRPKGIWGQRTKSDRTFVDPNFEDVDMRQDQRWLEAWAERAEEAVTKYDIDIAWFDTSFGGTIAGELNHFINQGKYDAAAAKARKREIGGLSEAMQQRFIASFYNHAAKEGREVEVVYKSWDIPYNIGMRDIENGNLDGAQYDPWIADINMMHHNVTSGWFYDERNTLKDANTLVDMLVDMTSKNGRLLLNVPPRADGSFAENVVKEVKGVGDWLRVNGQGIYGTTPWSIYGEGATYIKNPGHHGQGKYRGREVASFNGGDIRYTTKGRDIYAFVLGDFAEANFTALGSYAKLYPGEIKGVELLGYDGDVEWRHEPDGLVVKMPNDAEREHAYCFKVIR